MNVLDLFSGIGGFSLGLKRAGMKTIAFCEKDKFCQKVLRKHWSNVPIFEDITKLKGDMIDETIELVCGGFPCQPFSVAGKRKGKEDNRHLWPEMFRIICETNPSWIIGENVAGIINLELEQVCIDLESEGYEVQAFVIPACAVNAPHRRDRVWIIGHSKSRKSWESAKQERRQDISRANSDATDTRYFRQEKPEIETMGGEQLCGNVANASIEGWPGNRIQGEGRLGFGDRDRKGETLQKLNMEQWDENWIEVATRLCRVDARVPARMDRLKCLGNSVVPQIVEIIGNYIMKIERK